MTSNQLDLMDALFRCIKADEEFAREIAEIAHRCEQDGNHAVAEVMRNVGQNHPVKDMESRAKFAALTQEDADNCRD